MSTPINYRLKKDICLPGRNIKSGAIYVPHKDGKKYYNKENNHYISARTLKASTEWFEEVLSVSDPVKERIVVEETCAQDIYGLITNGTAKYHGYLMFKFKGSISSTQMPLIKKAIESVLNNDIRKVDMGIGMEYYLQDGTRLCEWSSYERLFDQLQEVLKDKFENKTGKTGLAIDIGKGSMEEAIQLGKLWQKFQPTVINSFLPERKISLPRDFISIKNLAAIDGSGKKVSVDEMLKEFFKQPLQFFTPDNENDISLKMFIKKFVGKNTLIRLWEKDGSGHKQILDCPKMEWDLCKGEFANRKVLYIKDIAVLHSNYAEALNIVIEQPQKLLLKTEDGVMIYNPSTTIFIVDKSWNIWESNAASCSGNPEYKYFHSRVELNQYLLNTIVKIKEKLK